MITQTYNFVIYQGTDVKRIFALRCDRGIVRLRGYEAGMQLRSSNDLSVKIDTLSTANERISIDVKHGWITCLFSKQVTTSFPVGTYKYDLLVKSPYGEVTRVIGGTISVRRRMTSVLD